MKNIYLLFLTIISLCTVSASAQDITINGTVVDAQTGEGIPYANVYLSHNKNVRAVTDLKGQYKLSFGWVADSLEVSVMGYASIKKVYSQSPSQFIHFDLEPTDMTLEGVDITPGENPAFAIIRSANKNRKKNAPKSLNAYQYQSYSRIEGFVNPSTKGINNMKVVKDMQKVAAKYPSLKDKNGKTLIPIFVSETVSDFYHHHHPKRLREIVQASNTEAIGLEKSDGLNQVLSTNQNVDFSLYDNEVLLFGKYFISPISDEWRFRYDYDLLDSLEVDGDYCYELNLVPRNAKDLVFIGKMWITKKDFAIKKVDFKLSPNANINFISDIKIRQEMYQSSQGPWIPKKTAIEVNVSEISSMIPSIFARYTTTNSQFVTNQAKPLSFYQKKDKQEKVLTKDSTYWDSFRPKEALGKETSEALQTIKDTKSVRTYTAFLRILTMGYYTPKNFFLDFGHYGRYYAWNDIEGHRPGIAFRTNDLFSKRIIISTRLAYGTLDHKVKQDTRLEYLLNKKKYLKVGLGYKNEAEPLSIANRFADDLPNLFVSSNRFLSLSQKRPFEHQVAKVWLESQLTSTINARLTLNNKILTPLFLDKNPNPTDPMQSNKLGHINTTESILELTFRKGRRIINNQNKLVNINTKSRPKLSITSIFGFAGLGGEYEYQKLFINLSQKNKRIFAIGTGDVELEGGYIFQDLPYPLLKVHLGSNSPVLLSKAFNTMNSFEFVSDQYLAFRYTHHFGGLIFNRIPLLKHLEWRAIARYNVLWGSLRQSNLALNSQSDFARLSWYRPYAEVSYGVENIFKMLRVEVFHRLDYLDQKDIKPVGVKFSISIRL